MTDSALRVAALKALGILEHALLNRCEPLAEGSCFGEHKEDKQW